MQRHSLFWLLQQLIGCVSPDGGCLSTLLHGALCWRLSLEGLVGKDIADGDPVPFLDDRQSVTFLDLKRH